MSRRQSEITKDYAQHPSVPSDDRRNPLHFQSEPSSQQTSLQQLSARERQLTSVYGCGLPAETSSLQSTRLSQIQPLGAAFRKRNALLNQKLTLLAKERIENRHDFDALVGKTSSLIKVLYGDMPSRLSQQRADPENLPVGRSETARASSLEPMAKEQAISPPFATMGATDYACSSLLRHRKTDIDVRRVVLETPQQDLNKKRLRDRTPNHNRCDSLGQSTSTMGVDVIEPRIASVDRKFEENKQDRFVTDRSRERKTFAQMLPQYVKQRFAVKKDDVDFEESSSTMSALVAQKAVRVRNTSLQPFRTTTRERVEPAENLPLAGMVTQTAATGFAKTGHSWVESKSKPEIQALTTRNPAAILATSNDYRQGGDIMIQECDTLNVIQGGFSFQGDQKEETRQQRRFLSPYQQLLPILGAKGEVKNVKRTRGSIQNSLLQTRRTSKCVSPVGTTNAWVASNQNGDAPDQLAVKQLIDCKGGGMSITTSNQQRKPVQYISKEQQVAQVSMSALEAAPQSCLPQANMSFNSQNGQQLKSRANQATQQKSSSLFLKSNECNTTTQVGSSGGVTSGYTPWSPSKTSKIPNSAIVAVSKAELIDQLSSVNSFMAEQRQRHQTQGFSQYINAMQQDTSSYTETRQNSLNCPDSGSSQLNTKQNLVQRGTKGRTVLRNGPQSGQTTVKTEWSNGKGNGMLASYQKSKPEGMKVSRMKEISQKSDSFTGRLQSRPQQNVYANPAAGQKILDHGGVVNQASYNLNMLTGGGQKVQTVPFYGNQDVVKRQGSSSNFQFSPFVIDTSSSPAYSASKTPKKHLSEVRPQKNQKSLKQDPQSKDQVILLNRAQQQQSTQEATTTNPPAQPKTDSLSKALYFQQMGEYYTKATKYNLTQQKTFSKLKRVADLVEPNPLQSTESQLQVKATEISPHKAKEKQNGHPQLTFPSFKGTSVQEISMIVGKAATYSPRKQTAPRHVSSAAASNTSTSSPTHKHRLSQNQPVVPRQDILLAQKVQLSLMKNDGLTKVEDKSNQETAKAPATQDAAIQGTRPKLVIVKKKSSSLECASPKVTDPKISDLKAQAENKQDEATKPVDEQICSISPKNRTNSLQHATSESLLANKMAEVSTQPKTTRNNKQTLNKTEQQNINTNSSEGKLQQLDETEKDSDSKKQTFSFDQSVENLNQQSTCSIKQASTKKHHKGNDETTLGKHRQSRGALTKTGNRNKRKRKATGGSIISSKPSLHSNVSKVGVQAVPAVHDINTGKFITDPRKLETYYMAKPTTATGKDAETTALPTNLEILQENKKSNIFASRYNKRHSKRKDSHSVTGHSSHLSSTKSQPKITIRNSRASLRSSSAVRSSKPLKAVASTNCAASAKDQKLTPDQAYQPNNILNTQPPSVIRGPRFITKEASTTSVVSYLRQRSGESNDNKNFSRQQHLRQPTTEASAKHDTKKLAQLEYLALKSSPNMTTAGGNAIVARGSKASQSSATKQTLIKASHVQRVRQMQNSQKTLEVQVRELSTFEQQRQKQSKEPQSASKVYDDKPKQSLPVGVGAMATEVVVAYSAISRCASSITSTLDQKQQHQGLIAHAGGASSSQQNLSGHADKRGTIDLNRISILQTFDHKRQQDAGDIDSEMQELHQEVLKAKRVSQTVEKLTGQESLVSKAVPMPNPYSTMGSKDLTSFKQVQEGVGAVGKAPRLVPSLTCKTGSSMRQCPNQTVNQRSFQADDDYIASPMNQPYTSCRAYVITDSHHNKVLQSKNADEVREMASLTKIMTTIVVLELATELHLDLRATYFKVSQKAASTIGTSAYLIETQVLTIWDLLHGLMLPSGNDAAMTLAENFTELLTKRANRQAFQNQSTGGNPGGGNGVNNVEPVALKCPTLGTSAFIKVMNKTARKIHMRNTNYANPHGLADKSNHSTARELAMLSNYGMKNELFSQIVNTKSYSSINYLPRRRTKKLPNTEFTSWSTYDERDIPFPHGDVEYVQYHQTWYNSNKLLDEPGFSGVKTGITSTAGACLSVFYKNPFHGRNLVTIVLGSKSIEYRWKDSRRLTLWVDSMVVEEHQRKVSSPTKVIKGKPLPGFRT